MLREDGVEERPVDAGRGPRTRHLHSAIRPRKLEGASQTSWFVEVWEELQAAVDQLSEAGYQAREF